MTNIDSTIGLLQKLHAANARLEAQLAEVYKDRNLLAQLAAYLASEIDFWEAIHTGHSGEYGASVGTDPDEPDWTVVYVDTPEGQMSWHVPKEEMILPHWLHSNAPKWDGHSSAEKWDRIRRLVTTL